MEKADMVEKKKNIKDLYPHLDKGKTRSSKKGQFPKLGHMFSVRNIIPLRNVCAAYYTKFR
ncbi:hypothetical protein BW716_33000 [[Flexibacter] sp. ATCC 35208]|nr:hypothetical protein BW716_33000 [[Flexibacter] sp. ATCC 35208]